MITDPFYWILLGLSIPVFWLLPPRHRYGFLAAASFLYLMTLEPSGVLALSALSLGVFLLAPMARHGGRRSWIIPGVVLGLLVYLAYFKYIPRILADLGPGHSAAKLIIPLGISYFTFKLIHYVIEVKRNNLQTHSPADFLCYVFLVPIFTAGPIERFDHFLKEREVCWQHEFATEGLRRIIHGLVKKLVLANLVLVQLYGPVNDGAGLIQQLSQLDPWQVWWFSLLTFLYMYLDFSAYSDIAIGSSRLFGIRIMENFNWPVFADNISIFWKRWHMTLAGWCQSYIYLPVLGLTRNPYIATYLTFVAIGLWHSGSIAWLIWGLFHATGISVYGFWNRYRRRRKWRGLNRPYGKVVAIPLTLAFVSTGSAIVSVDGHGGPYDILRVVVKLTGFDLPA
jgi:alginate O-acetyltransferase complex protein AlgI